MTPPNGRMTPPNGMVQPCSPLVLIESGHCNMNRLEVLSACIPLELVVGIIDFLSSGGLSNVIRSNPSDSGSEA